jgi:hypothetical protein
MTQALYVHMNNKTIKKKKRNYHFQCNNKEYPQLFGKATIFLLSNYGSVKRQSSIKTLITINRTQNSCLFTKPDIEEICKMCIFLFR